MDETPVIKMWFEHIEIDGRKFATAKEYTDYMTEHRLWGPHTKPFTHEEWEATKAKKLAETGEVLGTAQFVPGKGSLGDGKIK